MAKPVILTGLRANNDLHIGNYFGALLPLIDMAKNRAGDFQINLFVPDLHSFTTPIDHNQLQKQITHNLKLFVAAGLPLDHQSIHIYRQSHISAHSELTWILDCFTNFGEMNRMTQFAEKSGEKRLNEIVRELLAGEDTSEAEISAMVRDIQRRFGSSEKSVSVSVGLFNYPVLMAADILLYGAEYVPVGDDQTQHLEFARDIAMRMNVQFGDLFVVPKPVKEQHKFFGKDQGLRIKDLQDPTKKMSKSEASEKGVIFLGDKPGDAAKKIMSAETDSVGKVHYDLDKQPGISNLLQIHALLSGEDLQEVIKHHEGQESYGDLKKEVAEQVQEFLTDFQARLAAVDDSKIHAKLQSSEAQMRALANDTLEEVQKAVGLR
jgi:tryptophanyl-tRNA synthetase